MDVDSTCRVLFDGLLVSFVLCSFGVQTDKLRGHRLGMVGKTGEVVQVLGYDGT